MPFRSKSQMRAAFAQDAEDRSHGRKPQWNAKKWAAHTPNIKDLPEHVKHAELGEEFQKIAEALMNIPPLSMRQIVEKSAQDALQKKTGGMPIAYRTSAALKK